METKDLVTKKNIEILKALADETRLRIIKLLEDREKCQCEIIPVIGKSQSSVSQHLQTLVNSGVLEYRKEGQRTFYKIRDERVKEILRLVDGMSRDLLLELSKLAGSVQER